MGGIHANIIYPACNSLPVPMNVINELWQDKAAPFFFLRYSCIHTKYTLSHKREDVLLSGLQKPPNRPYAIAKTVGIIIFLIYNRQYGADFFSVMSINFYDLNDNCHPKNSPVFPLFNERFQKAEENGADKVEMILSTSKFEPT